MEFRFQDWFSCPVCNEREVVSTFSYKTEIVFECYGCGQISEYQIGEDIPLQNLDVDAITEIVEAQLRE